MSTAAQSAPSGGQRLSPQNYRFFQDYIYRESGIVLEESKDYLIESRLGPIARRRNLSDLNEICTLLQSGSRNGLHREVVEAMTTNETLFFRDPPLWADLKATILPELIRARSNSRCLRFWSAAVSSGQEAYSLAMLLSEMGLAGWNLSIYATDISQQMVDRARAGEYTQMEINRGMPAALAVKYFSRKGLSWCVNDELKRMIRFERFDLRQPLQTAGTFDIVMCRNVLIYFDVETKCRILRSLRGAIARGGCLVLGSAETTLNLDPSLQRKTTTRASFYEVRREGK